MPDTHSLIKHFAQLTDPRIERSKRHARADILIISICALLCGAEGGVSTARFSPSCCVGAIFSARDSGAAANRAQLRVPGRHLRVRS